jgi:hypothetical protein
MPKPFREVDNRPPSDHLEHEVAWLRAEVKRLNKLLDALAEKIENADNIFSKVG